MCTRRSGDLGHHIHIYIYTLGHQETDTENPYKIKFTQTENRIMNTLERIIRKRSLRNIEDSQNGFLREENLLNMC